MGFTRSASARRPSEPQVTANDSTLGYDLGECFRCPFFSAKRKTDEEDTRVGEVLQNDWLAPKWPSKKVIVFGPHPIHVAERFLPCWHCAVPVQLCGLCMLPEPSDCKVKVALPRIFTHRTAAQFSDRAASDLGRQLLPLKREIEVNCRMLLTLQTTQHFAGIVRLSL